MRARYLVSYDISEARRLRKVHQAMLGFGDPMQYSVFCCDLSDKELVLLKEKVSGIIHHRHDRVMIVHLGPVDGRGAKCFQFLGEASPPEPDRAIIV